MSLDLSPDRVREAAARIRAAERGVRVLRTLSWGEEVRARFLERDGRELPVVERPRFDASPVHAELDPLRRELPSDGPVGRWLHRSADAVATAADLLADAGTPRFLEHGAKLYGLPRERGTRTALDLAHLVEGLCKELSRLELGGPAETCHLADAVADTMREACRSLFGAEAPEVVVVDHLSANALAGPRRIQLRRDACFSDLDVRQLVEHEAYVHVCTALNGRAQQDLPLLAAAHPGTTRTQEGLAIFAEFITGALDPDRFRRLADRVLAIQMSVEGADFLDVYRFFLERGVTREQAFENARRVFRGGVLTGGAPFTKDVVYLDGFLRVTSFLRALLTEGRLDCLPLLFVGKLELADVPALAALSAAGLCRPPRHLPPWAADRRFLVSWLTYSRFLGSAGVDEVHDRYREVLAHAPPTGLDAPEGERGA